MSEPKTNDKSDVPFISLLADRPFFARYKKRDPDPGICRIITIDWEDRSISMSNGCCRYYPSFDEVEIVSANDLDGPSPEVGCSLPRFDLAEDRPPPWTCQTLMEGASVEEIEIARKALKQVVNDLSVAKKEI